MNAIPENAPSNSSESSKPKKGLPTGTVVLFTLSAGVLLWIGSCIYSDHQADAALREELKGEVGMLAYATSNYQVGDCIHIVPANRVLDPSAERKVRMPLRGRATTLLWSKATELYVLWDSGVRGYPYYRLYRVRTDSSTAELLIDSEAADLYGIKGGIHTLRMAVDGGIYVRSGDGKWLQFDPDTRKLTDPAAFPDRNLVGVQFISQSTCPCGKHTVYPGSEESRVRPELCSLQGGDIGFTPYNGITYAWYRSATDATTIEHERRHLEDVQRK